VSSFREPTSGLSEKDREKRRRGRERRRKRFAEDPEYRRRKREINRSYYARHREEIRARCRKRYRTDAGYRRRKLISRYRLSLDDYDAMLARQAGRCAICAKGTRLFVDHCHLTGKVRGLLCMQCNAGLGYYADNPDMLRAAASFLDEVAERDKPQETVVGTAAPSQKARTRRRKSPRRFFATRGCRVRRDPRIAAPSRKSGCRRAGTDSIHLCGSGASDEGVALTATTTRMARVCRPSARWPELAAGADLSLPADYARSRSIPTRGPA
jgi:hypothetical protein